MMLQATFAIPGDLNTRTGGYIYDQTVLGLMPLQQVDVDHCELAASFPFPSTEDLAATAQLLRQARPGPLLVDGLAFGVLPPELLKRLGRPVTALVHHPLGLEAGMTVQQQAQLLDSEKKALTCAAHVIVTSPATRQTLLQDFAVPDHKITVAEPGTAQASRAKGSGQSYQVMIAVGAIIPRKGYDVLVEALAGLPDRDWSVTIIGSKERDVPTASRLQAQIDAAGLSTHVKCAGEFAPEDMAKAYDRADVFLMPSHYEGYGMALADAMAHGLAIIATTGGAAAQTVPDNAAIKIPPGDANALREAISALLASAPQRQRLADASYAAAQSLPRWTDTARIIADVLKMQDA